MTWKEWKEEIEKLGIKDEDEVEYIDVHGGEMRAKQRILSDGRVYWAIWS